MNNILNGRIQLRKRRFRQLGHQSRDIIKIKGTNKKGALQVKKGALSSFK